VGSDEYKLLKGTLDTLILQVLERGPRHGWSISRRIRDLSDEVFDVGQGSLYPALQRLEAKGWVDASWGVSELGRRARFYRLTRSGRRRLRRVAAEWRHFAATLDEFLQSSPEESASHGPAEADDLSPTQAMES